MKNEAYNNCGPKTKKAVKEKNMFPFSYKRTIEAPVNYGKAERISEILLQTLVQRIKAEDPARFLRDKNQIAFAGGSPMNWRLLAAINYGEIKVVALEDRLRVSYELGFTGLFLISILLVLMIAVTSNIPPEGIILFAFFWLFIFGGNYALAVVRFESFMRSAISKSVSS